MLESREPAVFERMPVGGFVAGANWFYFALDLTLFGCVIWGTPTVEDIDSLVRLLERELARPPHDALVDFRHLEGVVEGAFDALASYTLTHEEALAHVVRKAAIVRPQRRVHAAVVAGFFDASTRPFPVSLWPTSDAALTHLGRTDAPAISERLEAVRACITGVPEILRHVRAKLSACPADASVARIARELGLSARTLQRRLAEHRTSFEAELQDVRLAAAERLLCETEDAITTLALDLGFKTAQHFSTLFRARTGETPSSFRARRRVA